VLAELAQNSGMGCNFSIWHGSKVVKLKRGMTDIAVNKKEDLR
jgi:hypothetical protein